MIRWLKRIVLAAVIGLILWQAWDRLFVTEPKRIKRAIAKMEQAVEDNKLLVLAESVAADYADDHGLDKSSLLAAMAATRRQYAALFIHISDLHIQVAPDGATSQATLIAKILTKDAAGGATEINAERIRLSLRKINGQWKLTRTESPELRFD